MCESALKQHLECLGFTKIKLIVSDVEKYNAYRGHVLYINLRYIQSVPKDELKTYPQKKKRAKRIFVGEILDNKIVYDGKVEGRQFVRSNLIQNRIHFNTGEGHVLCYISKSKPSRMTFRLTLEKEKVTCKICLRLLKEMEGGICQEPIQQPTGS